MSDFWERVTMVAMLTVLVGIGLDWPNLTAVAGVSIAAATLALRDK